MNVRKQIMDKLEQRKLSDSTMLLYTNTAERIMNKLGIRKVSDLPKFETVIIKETASFSNQTKKTIYSVFSILLPKSEKMLQLRSNAMQAVNNHYSSRKMTDSQKNGKITVEQIFERKEELLKIAKERPSLINVTNYLIVALMAGGTFPDIPPRRLEWVLVKLYDIDKKKDNYYDASSYTFYFNSYKTNEIYSTQTVHVKPEEEELRDMIDYYLNEFSPRKTFFIKNHKNSPFSKSDISKRFKQIFQKYTQSEEGSITINDCRVAWVTHSFKNNTIEQAEELAEKMAHSFNTANNFYRKI